MAARKKAKASIDMKAHLRRSSAAWAGRMVWDSIYEEAYHWVLPYRRPKARDGEASKRTAHLFDNTGIVSTFRGAGQLQQDLFPPGQPFFKLKPGPVTKLVAKAQAAAGAEGQGEQWFARQLDSITEQITPFFMSGEWDNAASELCLDLYVGTGIMLILPGDKERPVRFVTIPIDECALEPGPYGDVGALFWKPQFSRRAIKGAFPDGDFSAEFIDALNKSPEDEIELRQDFIQDDAGWKMIVSCGSGDDPPVTVQTYRTRPFISPRFYRVPGEAYGRGPALLALPTIKTLNKTMEMTLKNAAIQMMGIWGYRPGGTFNPATAPIRPGAMWPMQATGGVMGADVTRLDPASGRSDVSSLILQELRVQVQAALHDSNLPEGGATPKSAAEIMARMSRVKANYVGAFGRMVHEIIPVIVPRVIEILYNAGLIVSGIKIDQLLVAIDVTSPLAQSLKADRHRVTIDTMGIVAQIEGPERVARRFNLDEAMPDMIRDIGVESQYVRSAEELATYDKNEAEQMQAAQVAQAALQKPKEFSDVLVGEQQEEPAE